MYKNEMALRNILEFIPTHMRPPYSSCTAGKSPRTGSAPLLGGCATGSQLECGCEAHLEGLGYHITYFVRPSHTPFPSFL